MKDEQINALVAAFARMADANDRVASAQERGAKASEKLVAVRELEVKGPSPSAGGEQCMVEGCLFTARVCTSCANQPCPKCAELEKQVNEAMAHLYQIGATRGTVDVRSRTAREMYDHSIQERVELEKERDAATARASEAERSLAASQPRADSLLGELRIAKQERDAARKRLEAYESVIAAVAEVSALEPPTCEYSDQCAERLDNILCVYRNAMPDTEYLEPRERVIVAAIVWANVMGTSGYPSETQDLLDAIRALPPPAQGQGATAAQVTEEELREWASRKPLASPAATCEPADPDNPCDECWHAMNRLDDELPEACDQCTRIAEGTRDNFTPRKPRAVEAAEPTSRQADVPLSYVLQRHHKEWRAKHSCDCDECALLSGTIDTIVAVRDRLAARSTPQRSVIAEMGEVIEGDEDTVSEGTIYYDGELPPPRTKVTVSWGLPAPVDEGAKEPADHDPTWWMIEVKGPMWLSARCNKFGYGCAQDGIRFHTREQAEAVRAALIPLIRLIPASDLLLASTVTGHKFSDRLPAATPTPAAPLSANLIDPDAPCGAIPADVAHLIEVARRFVPNWECHGDHEDTERASNAARELCSAVRSLGMPQRSVRVAHIAAVGTGVIEVPIFDAQPSWVGREVQVSWAGEGEGKP